MLRPERFFVVCALAFGLPILFFRPAYDVPDFGAHLMRGYSLAGGAILPQRLEADKLYNAEIYQKDVPYVGGYVPEAAARYINVAIPNYSGDFEKVKPRDQLRLYLDDEDKHPVLVPNNTAAVYNPLSYSTLAIGFIIGNALKLSVYASVLLVSAMHFTIWLLLIRKAIQKAVIGKWFIVVLSLMPMTLFLAPSISTDPLLIGVSILFFAYLTHYMAAKEKLVIRDIAPIIILAIALATMKQTYFIIILLMVLLHHKFKTTRDRNWMYALGIGVPIFMVGIWTLLIRHMNIVVSTATGKDTQILSLLTSPLNVIEVYLNTIIFKFDSVTWTFFGVLGRLSLPIPLLCVILLAVALAFSLGLNTGVLRLKRWQIALFAAVFAGSILLIFTSFYLFWSPFGSRYIDGLQGRYFIPVVVFALPLLAKIKFERASHPVIIRSIQSIVVLCSVVSTILMSRFYYPDFNLLQWISSYL